MRIWQFFLHPKDNFHLIFALSPSIEGGVAVSAGTLHHSVGISHFPCSLQVLTFIQTPLMWVAPPFATTAAEDEPAPEGPVVSRAA